MRSTCLALGVWSLGGTGALAAPTLWRPLLVTVDDLPIAAPGKHRDAKDRAEITHGLLAALDKHHIHAVGLVVWNNVLGPHDEQLLGTWLQAGHELGNHSFGHLDYTATDSTAYIADVEHGRTELAAFLRRDSAHRQETGRFFRFPYLREGDTPEKLGAMRRYLTASGQRNLPVTIDDEDWSYEAGWVAARGRGDRAAMDSIAAEYHAALRMEVADHESRGDVLFGRPVPQILLLHANSVGVAQWDRLFTWLEHTGHRFATADEVLADSAFAAPQAYVGRYGCSLWYRLLDGRRRVKARAAIQQLLDASAANWNKGDLDAFCADYAEDALFIAPSGTTRGREAVLDRYKTKYVDKAGMGTLAFELIEIRLTSGMEGSVLGSARPALVQGASVAARWTLTYPDHNATGLTLLVLRPRGGGGWEILQDSSM